MNKILTGTLDTLLADLAEELTNAATSGIGLRTVGFAGPPGVGKSTAVDKLCQLLERQSIGIDPLLGGVLSMDGFHKSNRILETEGLRDQKGAPDTFDVVGFLMTLDRVHAAQTVTYAPVYDRNLHEPIAASSRIECTGIVLVEGNYLALQDGPWTLVREGIDLLIFMDLPQKTLISRLIERQQRYGADLAKAGHWVRTVDQPNIITVEGSVNRADRVWKLQP